MTPDPAAQAAKALDDDLLRRVADGDREAFRLVMERHGRAMVKLAQRVTGSAAIADEIVQDSFLKVWMMAPQWQSGGRARFSTWLYRVVLNACLDVRRRPVFHPLGEEAEEVPDIGVDGFDGRLALQRRAILEQALSSLPERQRLALSLHYFSELSAFQSAQVLEVSVSALESLLVRGKRTLRKTLARKGISSMADVW